MKANLSSTAPYIYCSETLPEQDHFLLFESKGGGVEVGVRRWDQGPHEFACDRDMLVYFRGGRGLFRRNTGETIEVVAGSAVHFKTGWHGGLECLERLSCTYMTCDGASSETTPVLHNVRTTSPLKDWGSIPTMIEGTSRTAGILLSRDTDRRAESGIWTCTPGLWRCEVTSDEYCHFLEGRCTYTHENGELIRIEPDTLAFFPQGWKGTCQVSETIRKVYMIRQS